MAQLKITDVPPYDGEYEIPSTGWNKRELHYIKQISGVRAGEIEEALGAGDIAVFVGVTACILKRNGFLDVELQPLWDSGDDDIDLGHRDEGGVWRSASEPGYKPPEDPAGEGEERPPVTATPGGSSSSAVGVANGNAGTPSSGEPSSTGGGSLVSLPSPTGGRSSASLASDLETSAS